MHTDKADVIHRACDALSRGDVAGARKAIAHDYPFRRPSAEKRSYTPHECMQVFTRDGFIDRYSGSRLVFPPVLRLLSQMLPDEFPAHPNWKMSDSHLAYWELFPTIDHVVPVARGGKDEPENWVCTSMKCNGAKSNWTLDELGWTLHPVGDLREWDGLTGWFLEYAADHPELVATPYAKRWVSAARRVPRDI